MSNNADPFQLPPAFSEGVQKAFQEYQELEKTMRKQAIDRFEGIAMPTTLEAGRDLVMPESWRNHQLDALHKIIDVLNDQAKELQKEANEAKRRERISFWVAVTIGASSILIDVLK